MSMVRPRPYPAERADIHDPAAAKFASICFAPSWQQKNVPFRLTSWMKSQSASVMSSGSNSGKPRGIVDQAMERAERSRTSREQPPDLVHFRKISLKDRSTAALARDLFGFSARMVVVNRHVEAAPREFDRDHSPDSLRRAGDEDAPLSSMENRNVEAVDSAHGLCDVCGVCAAETKGRFELRGREVHAVIEQMVEEPAEGCRIGALRFFVVAYRPRQKKNVNIEPTRFTHAPPGGRSDSRCRGFESIVDFGMLFEIGAAWRCRLSLPADCRIAFPPDKPGRPARLCS